MLMPPRPIVFVATLAFCAGLLVDHGLVALDRAAGDSRTVEMLQGQVKDLQSENARIEHKLDELNAKPR